MTWSVLSLQKWELETQLDQYFSSALFWRCSIISIISLIYIDRKASGINLSIKNLIIIFVLGVNFNFLFFYCILGFGVNVKNMQDSHIGTHVAVWFAAFLPFTYIWHFSPCYLSPAPHPPLSLSYFPLQTAVCDASLPVSMCCHCSTPTYEWEHVVFHCSCVSLLRMMVSRFIHIPTKDTNSQFLMAAWYSMVYMCHIFPVQSIIDGPLGWFQVFAIVNCAAMNIRVHVSL